MAPGTNASTACMVVGRIWRPWLGWNDAIIETFASSPRVEENGGLRAIPVVSDYSDEGNTWELKIDTDGYRLHFWQYSRVLLDHLTSCIVEVHVHTFRRSGWRIACTVRTRQWYSLGHWLFIRVSVWYDALGSIYIRGFSKGKTLYLPPTRNCSMTSSPHLERRTKPLQWLGSMVQRQTILDTPGL